MLHRIEPPVPNPVIDLAKGLSIHGMAHTVLEGVRPGVVLVDDLANPRSLFLGAPEGTFAWSYLAGDPSKESFADALRGWLFEEAGLGDSVGFSFVACDSDAWAPLLERIIDPRTIIPDRRLHCTCTSMSTQRVHVPAGYRILPLDRALFDSDATIPDTVRQWLDSNFGSAEGFLARGFGAVAVHENAIVAWCLTDSVHDDSCDIGVEAEAAHQKKGLAVATTAHVLAQAFARGLHQVGWHCHAINTPSVKTVERSGFQLQDEYVLYPVHFDPEKHAKLVEIVAEEFTQDAREALDRGATIEAHRLCASLLRLVASETSEPYLLAARAAAAVGKIDEAWEHLETAIAAGWSVPEVGEEAPELASLAADPRWRALSG